MLHDPEMEVTCDGDGCTESVRLPMQWRTGGYDLTDAQAEAALVCDHDWQVVDGKHLCGACFTQEDNR